MNAERSGSRAGPFFLPIPFLCRILYSDLVQSRTTPGPSLTKEGSKAPSPAGFHPARTGKMRGCRAKDLSRFSLTQSQLLPDSPHLRRQQRLGIDAGPEGADRCQVLFPEDVK